MSIIAAALRGRETAAVEESSFKEIPRQDGNGIDFWNADRCKSRNSYG
jgi:hypothetical protein